MSRIIRRSMTVAGLLGLLLLFLTACGSTTGAGIPASPTSTEARPAAALLTPQATPGPVTFPAADGPHTNLTEWWYYTGHLTTQDGTQYGFEFVIFQGNRSGFPPQFASHFAITDVQDGTFRYDQKGPVTVQPNPAHAIDLNVGGWTLVGSGPDDQIRASMPGYTIDLTLESTQPPVLHDGDGYFTWAPATGSYYYSRTSMNAKGTITVNGAPATVTGQAWMDHQWGNFLLFGGGGWDWYSIQLNNGVELMLWHSRDSQNQIIFGSGTYVDSAGEASQIDEQGFTITPTGTWTSPHSGASYPSGWMIDIPTRNLKLTIEPVIKDQELDTEKSTGTIYWEGDVRISGTQNAQPVSGQGYIELTGYATPATVP